MITQPPLERTSNTSDAAIGTGDNVKREQPIKLVAGQNQCHLVVWALLRGPYVTLKITGQSS